MNPTHQSFDSSSSSLSDWLSDAVALVQRVNARLKSSSAALSASAPVLRQDRKVLTDHCCLELAALVDDGNH